MGILSQKSGYSFTKSFIFISIWHFIFLSIFCVYRIAIMCYYAQYSFPKSESVGGFVLSTLLQGVWRDNFLFIILLGFPLFLLLFVQRYTRFSAIIRSIVILLYSLQTIIIIVGCAVNIPYYFEFCKPIDFNSLSVMNSSNLSGILRMILEDSLYFSCGFVALFLSVIAVCGGIIRTGKIFLFAQETKQSVRTIFVLYGLYVVIAGCSFIFRPKQINRAEYSTDYSMDKIALNPIAYFVASVINKNEDAYNESRAYINVLSSEQLDSCIAELSTSGLYLPSTWNDLHRTNLVEDNDFSRLPNVVLIIMEGLSANLMDNIGKKGLHITPFLDSLYCKSLHFPNCYSVGQRTALGLSGILNSYPSLLYHGNLFNYSQACRFNGLAYQLRQLGYNNTFYIPHEGSFDSMRTYLETHDFENVYSKEDYPQELSTITWGVCDDQLFEYVIPLITEQTKLGEPVFSAMITISNHDPYELPEYFMPRSSETKFQAIEYADWSLRKFFSLAQQQEWYDNTIFVLVSDHGRVQQEKECELSEQMHHIPLMFYGAGIETSECSSMTSQMDLMAILMGLLGQPYECNNFSQNVLQTPRDYVLYSAYDYLVCRSRDRLYLYRYEAKQDVCYIIKDGIYIYSQMDEIFSLMKKYCLSFYQTADNITAPYRLSETWM